jgi:hypothetical protein
MPDLTIAEVWEKYQGRAGELSPVCYLWLFSVDEVKAMLSEFTAAIRAHVEARCVWTVVGLFHLFDVTDFSMCDGIREVTGWDVRQWTHCPYCGRPIERKESNHE